MPTKMTTWMHPTPQVAAYPLPKVTWKRKKPKRHQSETVFVYSKETGLKAAALKHHLSGDVNFWRERRKLFYLFRENWKIDKFSLQVVITYANKKVCRLTGQIAGSSYCGSCNRMTSSQCSTCNFRVCLYCLLRESVTTVSVFHLAESPDLLVVEGCSVECPHCINKSE